MMKMHMNAHGTARRLRFVAQAGGPRPCYLCWAADDSVEHLFGTCHVVRQLRRSMQDLAGIGVERWSFAGETSTLSCINSEMTRTLAGQLEPFIAGHGHSPDHACAWLASSTPEVALRDEVEIPLATIRPDDVATEVSVERALVHLTQQSQAEIPAEVSQQLDAAVATLVSSFAVDGLENQTWNADAHFLHGLNDPQTIAAVMRFNSTVFHFRNLLKRGTAFNDIADLVRHGTAFLCQPQIQASKPSSSKSHRRKVRRQAPAHRPGYHVYRSDGAARGQGQRRGTNGDGIFLTAWGCAYFGTAANAPVPVAVSFGCMASGSTNNEAEYTGLLNSLRHAVLSGNLRCTMQVDSLLVARQVRGEWACRALRLRPLLDMAWEALNELERRGSVIVIEHIYREYNKVADRLANQALDGQAFQAWTATV